MMSGLFHPVESSNSIRSNRRRWIYFACGLALICFFGIGAAMWIEFVQPFLSAHHWSRRVDAEIRLLEQRRPADVDPDEWEFIVSWTINLHGNCGEITDRNRAQAFAEEFERRLLDGVDLATIDWIWDEYGRFSKYGKEYSEKYRPTVKGARRKGSWHQ
jgi:hypothetical protein